VPTTASTRRTVAAVWRVESARIVSSTARILGGDLGLAEEMAQDAVVEALERWPIDGIPTNPAAWLTTTARRRAIDRVRRDVTFRRKADQLGRHLVDTADEGVAAFAAVEEDVDDDVLRLMFTACHPMLSAQNRVALTLRLVGGLSTAEIARAFLVPEPTVGQRIWRAKKALASANVPFEVPSGRDLSPRLASVCEVVYLIFNEGYSATAGEHWSRPELCHEALRLGRMLAALAPAEPEAHGLVALMEIQASRLRARIASDGSAVLLLDQDRTRWDRLLIRRGLTALEQAGALGGADGRYVLQAAIAACHARATSAEDTDWAEMVRLYTRLGKLRPSSVVELNRAVALSYADGPEAALVVVEAIADSPELANYHLLSSVRADLLARLGRDKVAAEQFELAASMTCNQAEQTVLIRRATELRSRRTGTR
jgi:RNA polymerase sigma factor (sigma-70 family)